MEPDQKPHWPPSAGPMTFRMVLDLSDDLTGGMLRGAVQDGEPQRLLITAPASPTFSASTVAYSGWAMA